MPTKGRAVGTAKHHVRVDLRLPFVKGDIADECEHFDLFLNWDLAVLLLFDLEEPQQRTAEGAERRKLARFQAVLFGEGRQSRDNLVTGVEDDGVRRAVRRLIG